MEQEAFRRANEEGLTTTPLTRRSRIGKGNTPGVSGGPPEAQVPDHPIYDRGNINFGVFRGTGK